MTDPVAPRDAFLSQFTASVTEGSFVKLTLGKPRGPDQSVEKIFIRPISLGGQPQLSFVWHRARNEVTKNHPLPDAAGQLEKMLGTEFHSAHLFTTARTIQLEYNKKGVPRLTTGKAAAAEPGETAHDRKKSRLLPPESQQWLQALGVTALTGTVREGMADKHRQIHKFVEILSHLAADATLPASRPIEIADMGCGKGYLTFATHDYFNRVLAQAANVQGIDVRPDLVLKCNQIARDSGCTRLAFRAGAIQSVSLPTIDLLIALHACDTATDDAIVQGVQAGAALIVVAPCCQQEVRPQLTPPPVLAPALQHGIFEERHAEFATDALRALLLEWAGYDTKVFEFISTDHTAKNVMIAATKRRGSTRTEEAAVAVRKLAAFYGIKTQALARHLGFIF